MTNTYCKTLVLVVSGSELREDFARRNVFFIQKVDRQQRDDRVEDIFLTIPPISLSSHLPACSFRRPSFLQNVHKICLKPCLTVK